MKSLKLYNEQALFLNKFYDSIENCQVRFEVLRGFVPIYDTDDIFSFIFYVEKVSRIKISQNDIVDLLMASLQKRHDCFSINELTIKMYDIPDLKFNNNNEDYLFDDSDEIKWQ